MTELSLASCNVKDISPLASLSNLTTLNLGKNSITDVSSLKQLTNLKNVYLDSQRIELETSSETKNVKIQTAKDVDQKSIIPSAITPQDGKYQENNGMVLWTKVEPTKRLSFSFTKSLKFRDIVSVFSGKISQWIKNKYTVEFDSQGGSEVVSQNVWDGDPISAPSPPPQREGYTFTGWYAEKTGGKQWDFGKDVARGRLDPVRAVEGEACADSLAKSGSRWQQCEHSVPFRNGRFYYPGDCRSVVLLDSGLGLQSGTSPTLECVAGDSVVWKRCAASEPRVDLGLLHRVPDSVSAVVGIVYRRRLTVQ